MAGDDSILEIHGEIAAAGRKFDVHVPDYLRDDEDDDPLEPLNLSPLERFAHLQADVQVRASEKGRKTYQVTVPGGSPTESLECVMALSDLLDQYVLRTGTNALGRDLLA